DLYASNDYWEEPWGIMRKATYTIETIADLTVGDSDATIFPHIRRHRHGVIIRVPVDDVTTAGYTIYPVPRPEPEGPIQYWINDTYQEMLEAFGGRPRIDQVQVGGKTMPVPFQDRLVMVSQGAISDRPNWRPATSDRGLAMFHDMLFREMAKVEQGLD